MKKRSGKITRWYLLPAVVLLLAAFVMIAPKEARAAGSDVECVSPEGTNVEYQNYTRWSSPIGSYLTETDDGYMRVQADDGYVMALYYDIEFNRMRRVEVPLELPLFGGFYDGGTHYFIVTGQKNLSEDNLAEVYRITKYDKNWNRQGSCSLYGANTYVPFNAGCCRMAMDGKYLLVRTCHTMYASANDGLHHQANVTIKANTETMEIIESHTAVANSIYGYASHSFNQFILVEDHNAVAVDHGDAYPRSICLTTADGRTNVMSFPGEIGENSTGASVGGLEISSSHYLIAGNSVEQDDNNLNRSTRNIFVAAVDKNSYTVKINWLTDYAEGETGCSTPQFVQTDADQFMVLWSRDEQVYYTHVGADGSRQTQIQSLEGQLSDCVPLVSDGQVTWYTYNEGEETFYQIPVSGSGSPTVTERSYGHDDELLSVSNGHVTVHCKKCGRQAEGEAPTSFYVYWKDPGETSGSYWSWPQFQLLKGGSAEFVIDSISYSSSTGTKFSAFDGESSDPENFVLDMKKKTILFKEAGIYSATFWAVYNPDVRRTVTFDVRKPLEAVTLTTDMGGEQPYGTSFRLTARPDGGLTDDLICRFVQIDADGAETELNNGYANTCTWSPGAVGTYELRAEMTDPEDGSMVSSNTLSVTIQPRSISGAAVTGVEDQVFTGNPITPQPTVKLNGRTLVRGTDYTVLYINNVRVGTATVSVTGKGNYTGTVSVTFQILEKLPETLTLTADKSGTVSSETEVKLTATPKNCERTLLYRFMQEDPDGNETQLNTDDEDDPVYWWSGAKAGTYRLWVVAADKNDKSWSMTSNEIQLIVEIHLEEPFITKMGWTSSISEGMTATFYVEATGGALQYQWYYMKPGETTWRAVSSASGKTSEYSLVTEARHNGYQYYCRVYNDAGEDISRTITLEVIPKPVYVNPPEIITQPTSKAVVAGKKATFTVSAIGDDLTYQWYYSKDAGKTWSKVTAASGKTAKFTVTTAAKHNGYRYRCKVSNSEGTVTSSTVKLTVITTPKITTQPPKTKTVKAKAKVKLTVKATGEKLSYQWYVSKNGGKTWSKITAASGKKATYSFTAKKTQNGYRYRCVIKNAAGKVTSRATKLTVK